ncbi:aldolase/citrate lyase family protein [Extensimonas sp. H3M7-6]|uniref:aldolase/citrate lyase family protein n=1 Tax=Extensimonas soli TaxID=3031322 RepID=UPI0023DBD966|nr:aldolase/citrate lyase family protein [Extensimonas sp. H3M7-6]MDF1481462.1 aldolase/citrate lyase family protein [Extensimonas sp. H3M7-6]
MIEFLQITNDPALARRCAALPGMRMFVDLERHGKAERQAGRSTFISTHTLDDVGRMRCALDQAPFHAQDAGSKAHKARLMVRVNPLHSGSAREVDAVLAQGADWLMLPMFHTPTELRTFSALVAGRAPIVALLETAGALRSLEAWVATPGLCEVFVGLNDLHLELGCRFMFEPLALGLLEPVAAQARERGLRFGFGGLARLDEGLLPGRDVLAEHLRLGSQAVILSRTFHRSDAPTTLEEAIAELRQAEAALAGRTAQQVQADRARIAERIAAIAAAQPAAQEMLRK